MRPTLRCLQSLHNLSQRPQSVSFIGLGRMGHEMAYNLFSKRAAADKGARFVVCDAVPEAAASFQDKFQKLHPESQVAIASTPEEAALASQVVITMLPSSPQVSSVYGDGILKALRSLPKADAEATLCIDSTTLDITVARGVAKDVVGTGAQMVDAPVSGGVTGAQAGTLSFLVGGPEESFKLSQPILSLMGQRIMHCGPSGAGLGAKICNNLVLGVEQIVVAEAMLLGQKLGLDPAILAGVINSSTGGCWASSVNNPVPNSLPGKSPPCERDYEGGFATGLMLKDMGLATNIAAEAGSALPLGKAAEGIYQEVTEKKPELARKDFSSHLRIIDKYSVNPPTTYLGSEFPSILAKPNVEYRQVNLTVPANIPLCYEPLDPEHPFEYIFDFTGEVQTDRTELIQINMTCNIARYLALESAKRNVKSHVRIQLPFYETSGKGTHDEKEDIKPDGVIGTWWHEALRMIAAIENLNLVVLRIGFPYGPYINHGNITSALCVGAVYGYMKKPMKSMWSPGKNPTNTIHADDVAGAAWACANWMAGLGRQAADAAAGEVIPFHNDKAKVKEVEGMPPHNAKIVAPLFNLVDDSASTLLSVGQVVTSFFGTTFEFFNLVESTKLKLAEDAVEDINEHHVGGWTEMLSQSNPPISQTPLSAYMDHYALKKHVVAFSNAKIKSIVGYQLKYPHLEHSTIAPMIEKWKADGHWPVVENSS
ncbi:hypothetical protein AX16_008668 [Volvariella volvacea WC 439]|nr:hypothetical protein AX16_008668 [Volvariella volvacea WC 439]